MRNTVGFLTTNLAGHKIVDIYKKDGISCLCGYS